MHRRATEHTSRAAYTGAFREETRQPARSRFAHRIQRNSSVRRLSRRTAARERTHRIEQRRGAMCAYPARLRQQQRRARGRNRQCVNGRVAHSGIPREIRAMRRGGPNGRAAKRHRNSASHRIGSFAVMRAVTPAARGQTGVLARRGKSRQRPQRKYRDQQNGKPAPHLDTMVNGRAKRFHGDRLAVRYHRSDSPTSPVVKLDAISAPGGKRKTSV